MKHQVSNSKSLLLSLLLIIGLSFSLSAQDKEAKKEISETYKVAKGFTLGIDNKYGTIEIVNWDKNECEVLVEMIVKAASEEKAQKILEKIEIGISESGSGVDFVTQYDMTNFSGKTSIEVKYKVSAPASINVKLSQKYGSIFLEDISGNADILLKYSTMKVQSLVNASGAANTLTMGYSEANIKTAGKLNSKLAYSEINFAALESWEGNIAYSSLSAESLGNKLLTEASYSKVKVENLEAGFELVDISCSYGDVKLVAASASCSFELQTKYGDIKAPKGSVMTKEDHGNSISASGKLGKGSAGKIVVNAKYSDIVLQ